MLQSLTQAKMMVSPKTDSILHMCVWALNIKHSAFAEFCLQHITIYAMYSHYLELFTPQQY